MIAFCIGAVVFLFMFGLVYYIAHHNGKKQAETKQTEIALEKAEETIKYEQEKAEIRQEVFSEAETRKAELDSDSVADGSDTGRARFERINDVLRGKPGNKS
jgi:predicted membrane protein